DYYCYSTDNSGYHLF
nr:immunoglobulin light chain junction region [Macaca mulatta]MOW18063.1 immunoglobulin light chain junction region [Macaca mulatta]MOW18367.1 immunoglobulin light chain junction region [Macaca mulatta]MOW18638.1 immunoglobulin light chain junction region [Macaca mulatta]